MNKNEDDVESQSTVGGGEEDADWAEGDDNGADEWLVPHLAAAMVMTEKLRN